MRAFSGKYTHSTTPHSPTHARTHTHRHGVVSARSEIKGERFQHASCRCRQCICFNEYIVCVCVYANSPRMQANSELMMVGVKAAILRTIWGALSWGGIGMRPTTTHFRYVRSAFGCAWRAHKSCGFYGACVLEIKRVRPKKWRSPSLASAGRRTNGTRQCAQHVVSCART